MKKKTIRRSLSLLCSLALILSLAIPAFAAEDRVPTDLSDIVISVGDFTVQRRSVPIYSQNVGGSTTYTGAFSANAYNGSQVAFTVNNTGSAKIGISLTITNPDTHESATNPTVYVSGYDSQTLKISNTSGAGLNVDVNFTLTTNDPGGMYCSVTAVQGENLF